MNNSNTAIDGNQILLQKKVEARNKIGGARVGDYLKLPHGIYTRFTHEWEHTIQTGGYSCSFYLSKDGFCSYSGGLDSGVKKSDLRLTSEVKKGFIWFFDGDIAGAGRGVDFEIDFRVFEPIEGADLSGCPQIKKYEKERYRLKAETITRINGNGQPYTMPIPELVIMAKREPHKMPELEIPINVQEICKKHGAIIEGEKIYTITVQPLTLKAMADILGAHKNESTFYNNWQYENTLLIKLI